MFLNICTFNLRGIGVNNITDLFVKCEIFLNCMTKSKEKFETGGLNY